MAILSNINGKFAVESSGAIQLSGSAGTSGYVLKSNGTGNAASWVDPTTIIGGPYLPLSGGTLTGATATASGISFTFGGTAQFDGDMTLPAAADNFDIGFNLSTTGKIRFGHTNWNNSLGLESYWMVLRTNQNEGLKLIDSAGNTYVQLNASNNSAGAYNSTFSGKLTISQSGADMIDLTRTNVGTYRLAVSVGDAFSVYDVGANLDRLVIDSSGDVGIGTTSPASKLQFSSNNNATNPGGKNYSGSAINTDGGDIATGRVFFQGYQNGATDLSGINNETNRVVLYNYTDNRYLQIWNHDGSSFIPSGNVGIGTTSPNTKLEVNTDTNNDGITLNGTSDNLRFNIKNDQATSGKRAFSMMMSGSYPALIFQGLNDSYGFTRNIMAIEHDGNVGIGTLSPIRKLHVEEATTWLARFAYNANNYIDVRYDGFNIAGGDMVFQNAGSEKMRIKATPTPQIRIGDGDNEQLAAIRLGGENAGGGRLYFEYNGDNSYIDSYGGHGSTQRYRDFTIGARNLKLLTGNTSGSTRMQIDVNGNVGIGETSPDFRLHVKDTQTSDQAKLQLRLEGNSGNYYDLGRNYQTGFFEIQGNQTGYNNIILAPDSGNVGIGTSPSVKLHVVDTTTLVGAFASNNATRTELAIDNTSTNNVRLGLKATSSGAIIDSTNHSGSNIQPLIFQVNASEKMRITSNGRVGINNTNPGAGLSIIQQETANPTVSIINAAGGGDGYVFQRFQYVDSTTGYRCDLKQKVTSGVVRYAFDVTNNTTDYPNNLVLDRGKVGIGMTTPTTTLDVGGGIKSTGTQVSTSTAPLSWQANGNTGTYTQTVIYANQSNSSGIINNAAVFIERGRLTNSASGEIRHLIIGSRGGQSQFTFASERLGINNDSPSAQLHLTANASNSVPFKLQGHNSTSVEQMLIYSGQSAGTGWYNIVAQAGGINQLIIYGNGNIQNANNSYGQISDERLKENIVDTTPKLEDIKKIKVKNFNFIGDDLKQIGMIAQEVEEVFPGLVEEIKQPDVEDTEGGTYKSIKYSVLVPILIKAIQELEARVKELENK